MKKFTDWDWSAWGSVNYKQMESKLISIIRECAQEKNPKRKALLKFRNFLLNKAIEVIYQRKISLKKFLKDIEKNETKIELDMELRNAILNLLNDPEYLAKNEKSVRDIIYAFSKLENNQAWTPYDTAIFFKKRAVAGSSWNRKRFVEEGEWCYIEGSSQDLLGCIVIIDNRKLRQDITKLILERAQNDPESAFPVFNSEGKLFWPR